jgi:hypothetical protein
MRAGANAHPWLVALSLTKACKCVLLSFMPAEAQPPVPTKIGRVLSLVRKLIDYGKQLADTVQQRAANPGFALFARPFGTVDIAVILARITNGLRHAAALEARLCARAARGQDLRPAPIRLPTPRAPRPARQVAPPDTQPEPQPVDPAQDPCLARLPTEEEIAARLATGLDPVVRRRPIGAVIVDICCDLGICPGHLDRAFWDEINHAIMMYGGSLVRFLRNLHQRLFAFGAGDRANPAEPEWSAAPPPFAATATGPP